MTEPLLSAGDSNELHAAKPNPILQTLLRTVSEHKQLGVKAGRDGLGKCLTPGVQACYPTYVDFDAVVKGLEQRKSRKHLKFWRTVSRRQDKYQMKIWDHVIGDI